MMGKSTKNRLLYGAYVGAVVVFLSAAPQRAEAQSSPEIADEAADDGGIVVTARRREERLQDVPISVVAFSGNQLAERSVRSLEDIAALAPGLRVEPNNNKPSTVQITLRGQRMYGVLSAQDPPNAFYFSDAPVAPIQGFNSALYDLASLQVLKGPQGTLFGRNTTGGAILVAPARPVYEHDASLTVRIGNYGTLGTQGYLNLPINDVLALRFSGFYNDHDGYATYVASNAIKGKKAAADEIVDLRFSALFNPSDSLENYFVGYYGKLDNSVFPSTPTAINPVAAVARYNGTASVQPYGVNYANVFTRVWDGKSNPRKVYGLFEQYDKTKLWGLVNTTRFNLDDTWTLKNIFSYRKVANKSLMDINGVDVPILVSFQDATTKGLSEELQLSATSLFDRVDLTAGLFYSSLKSLDNQAASNHYGTPSLSLAPFYTYSTSKSYAAYAQATARIVAGLSFTGGVRLNKDKRAIDYMHQTFDYFPQLGVPFTPGCRVVDDNGVTLSLANCLLTRSTSFRRTTYTLSLDYHISPDLMVYVTQRTGYRSGGFNQRAYSALQRLPFRPETNLSREIGLKSSFDLGDVQTRFNAAYYYDKLKNLQKSASLLVGNPPASASSTFNAAAGHVEGIELDFEIRPTRTLTIGANYAYTKTAYSSYSFIVGGIMRDFSDRVFAGIPKHQANIFASWSPPIPEEIGRLTIGADWFHTSGTFINEQYQNKAHMAVQYSAANWALLPDIKRPYVTRGYELLNARMDLRQAFGSKFDIGFYVKNLTDEYAEVGASSQYASSGTAAVTMGPPRTFGVEVTYDF